MTRDKPAVAWLVVPDLMDGFVFKEARYISREFQLEEWRKRESDLLFEIPFRHNGSSLRALVCVLVEHQSRSDSLMPFRTLLYIVLYWERRLKEWEETESPRGEFRLPPVLPIVFHTGRWTNATTLAEMLDEPQSFHSYAPQWAPMFWDLSARAPDDLLAEREEWLQMLAVVRAENADAEEFRSVLERGFAGVANLYTSAKVRWYDLMRLMCIWAF